MSLTRVATFALAIGVLAGCQNTPENYIEPTSSDSESRADDVSMTELINRGIRTSELGVGRLKDPAKTVGYAPGSTEVGEKFLDDSLIVDHVARQDADNHFGVTVTLFNNRDDAITFEWRIAFYNAQGDEVGGLERWKGKSLAGKSWGTISNSATVRGAVKFKVETRAAGSEAPPQ